MDKHPARFNQDDPLSLDDGTVERLLIGSMAPDDAPRAYRAVAMMFAELTVGPTPGESAGERQAVASITRGLALGAASSPVARRSKMNPRRRFQMAGATLVGTATLLAGLGAAGALPGAAQSIASDVLGTVGVSVPGPNSHSDGHADQRGPSSTSSSDASDSATTQSTDEGTTISDLAKDPSTTGVDKGAAVSSAASDGKSQAGTEGAAPSDAGAPVSTPPVSPPASTPPASAPPVSTPPVPAPPVTTPGSSQDGISHAP